MIHRDIKGQNVLLTENAEVKLGKCDLMPARVESSVGITPVTRSVLLEKWEPGLPLSTAPGPLCPCPRLPQQSLSWFSTVPVGNSGTQWVQAPGEAPRLVEHLGAVVTWLWRGCSLPALLEGRTSTLCLCVVLL